MLGLYFKFDSVSQQPVKRGKANQIFNSLCQERMQISISQGEVSLSETESLLKPMLSDSNFLQQNDKLETIGLKWKSK